MRLFPASLILVLAAMPAAAQDFTIWGSSSGYNGNRDGRIENFANCVVRADTAGAVAYVRTEYRSEAEREAIAKLAPAYAGCKRHLTRWGGTYASEANKRDAILVALHRYRNQMARRN